MINNHKTFDVKNNELKLFMFLITKSTAILLALLFTHINTFATVKSQLWQENHRGYSIEQIPGTGLNGTPVEYVAAGTVYTYLPISHPGWHFMHLDENGVIIDSRISYSTTTDEEFRVVDITVESATKFWITIQARHLVLGVEYDYIYVVGVDQMGNDLPLNPALHITPVATVTDHRNLYPTHSLFLGDALYICGYSAENTQSSNQPKDHSDKYGMFLKCDVNSTPVTTSFYFWNSDNSNFPIADYDMALRISPSVSTSGFSPDFPLLVTGSANAYGSGYLSGVLAMKFNSAGSAMAMNCYLPTAYAYSPVDPEDGHGVYGVDIRGKLYATPEEVEGGGYAILVNRFEDEHPNERSWGLLRVKEDLSVYDPTTNYSYVGLNDRKSWASQFLEVSYTDKSTNSGATILGEQHGVYNDEPGQCAGNISSPNKHPSIYNINPFTAWLGTTGSGLWDYTNGFGPVYNTSFFSPNTVHLSALGTSANGLDYLNGSLAAGEYLEDVTRLYTFGSISSYYLGSSNSGLYKYPAMIAPVGKYIHPPITNEYLRTKFIQTDGGPETTCNNYYQDCPDLFTSTTYSGAEFSSIFFDGFDVDDAYNYFLLTTDNYIPADEDCSTGQYKTTGINEHSLQSDPEFYPNPTSNELNIKLPHSDGSTHSYSFKLINITGKEILNKNFTDSNSQDIHLTLPELSKGIYIGILTSENTRYTHKVTIK